MATLGKIRRMYYRDGLSLSEISRRTSLSRNTIREWLKKPEGSEPRYRRQAKPGKLAAYEAFLTQSLETDLRPRVRHFPRFSGLISSQFLAEHRLTAKADFGL